MNSKDILEQLFLRTSPWGKLRIAWLLAKSAICDAIFNLMESVVVWTFAVLFGIRLNRRRK